MNQKKKTRKKLKKLSFTVFFKIGVLKNFGNSKENICARVSFYVKLQASFPQFIKKRGSGTSV